MTKFEKYIKENHPDPDWLMENKEMYDEMVRLGENFSTRKQRELLIDFMNAFDNDEINVYQDSEKLADDFLLIHNNKPI